MSRVCLLALTPVLAASSLAACGKSTSSGGGGGGTTKTTGPSAAATNDAKFFPGKKATGTPINIALMVDAGGTAVNQPETGQAAVAAVKYANDNLGGIAGHPINIALNCQTKEDPATARDCANQAVAAKVDAVVVTSTAQGDQMAPVITKAGIPYISASGAAASELTSANAYMLTAGFPGVLLGWAAYSKQNGYKAITVFPTGSPTVVAGVNAFGGPAFKAAGITLNTVPIPTGTPDATPQVSAGLKGNPGAIGIVGDQTECTAVLKALSTVGAASKAKRLVIQPCTDPTVVKAVGSALDGSLVWNTYETTGTNDEVQLYLAIMKKYAPSTETGGYAGVGYQGMLGFIRAANSGGLTGAVTPAAVSAAIKAAQNVPLPLGDGITFTCDGKALAPLVAICSKSVITQDYKNGGLSNPQVVQTG
jgi:branched-chain amino acid transport system substrate-binding protein